MFSAALDLKGLIKYKMYFLEKARKIECPTLIFAVKRGSVDEHG